MSQPLLKDNASFYLTLGAKEGATFSCPARRCTAKHTVVRNLAGQSSQRTFECSSCREKYTTNGHRFW